MLTRTRPDATPPSTPGLPRRFATGTGFIIDLGAIDFGDPTDTDVLAIARLVQAIRDSEQRRLAVLVPAEVGVRLRAHLATSPDDGTGDIGVFATRQTAAAWLNDPDLD